jgi:anti-anti-sigma factor
MGQQMDSHVFHAGVRREPGRSVVHVSGDLDLVSAPRLRTMLIEACQDPPCEILVDLTAVRFLDAQALGVLTATAQQVGELGCSLVVRGLSPLQEKVVRICGLERLLTIA